ncbi:MAG: NAD(P)-dependent oxidoreductase, partial [Bacteroidaceae bacterium]|nr:NAD(P)-dependent oxidoreductase [Bacteroidaceae bacterium]
MRILITGASGFIGSFLCEEGLKRGMETWAGMRAHSSKRWLMDERLKFATLDMAHVERLKEQLAAYKQEVGRWDVIIHAGGATKCLKREDFDLHNYVCTKHLVEALKALDMMPSQFLYVSSLSVLGPIREQQNADGTYCDM